MKKVHSSFFRKLLLLMLVVNIPLVFSITVFCYYSMRTIQNDTVKTVQTNQLTLVNIVETDIKYVEQQLYHIANMDDWNVLRETKREEITYDGIYALNQFRSRFQNVLGTSRLFKDIGANMEKANIRFSVNEGIDDFDREEYEALHSDTEEYVRFKTRDGNIYITSQNGWKQDLSVSMTAQIDLEKVRSLLISERSFPNEQMILVFDTLQEPVFVCDGASKEIDQAIAEKGIRLFEEKDPFGKNKILVHTSSNMGGFTIYSIVSGNDIFSAMKGFYAGILGIMAGSVLVVLSYGVIVSKMLQEPVKILTEGFQKVEVGDFSVRLNRDRNDEFSLLYQGFNSMTEKVARLIDENYVKELYAQRAVYRQLQSQINPHFLYNSFFVLQNMIREEDNENAAEFAQSLSKYFKFITKTEREEVLLEEETEHARTYLEIMKKRYGRRMEFQIICEDESSLQITVPRLILQPFIENVFIHGYHSGKSAIEIILRIFREGEDVLITIEDNGSGMEEQRLKDLSEELYQGSGQNDSAIFNVHKRLRIKFGQEYGVSAGNSEMGGCRISLRLSGKIQDEKC